MPVPNASPTGYRGIPVLGGNLNPTVIYQAAPYLRPVKVIAETGPSTDPTVRKLFAAHPALGTLPEQDQHALLPWSRIRTHARQEAICQQGDPASAVILVLEGYVKFSRPLPDGGEVLLEIAGPGDCAGELAALEKQPHDADITALSPCRLLMIDARQFRQAFERRPEGLLAILRLANKRLQRATEQLVDSRALTASARLAKALLHLAQLPSSGFNNAGCLLLRLSQSELGVMTGACREVVNKQLRAWHAAGLIRMSGGTVTSVHATALSKVLEDDAGRASESRHAVM